MPKQRGLDGLTVFEFIELINELEVDPRLLAGAKTLREISARLRAFWCRTYGGPLATR